MIKPLTQRQARLLEYIELFIAEHGYSPTIREMAAGLGYKASSNVHSLLEQLVKKGYVSKVSAGPRTIQVIKSLHAEPADPNDIADKAWKEGQKDGALAVFAHILYEHGIDVREASIDHPKVKELAERFGVKEFID